MWCAQVSSMLLRARNVASETRARGSHLGRGWAGAWQPGRCLLSQTADLRQAP